jgi:hypothetical protein
MSRRGELVVECDGGRCHAEAIYRPENLDTPLADLLSDDGWKRIGGRDRCPECVKENYDGPDDGEAWAGGFAENH